jgi:hypothetical protein
MVAGRILILVQSTNGSILLVPIRKRLSRDSKNGLR